MNSLQYKIGLKNDENFIYKQIRSLQDRQKLFAYYQQSKPDFIVLICEPHKTFKKESIKSQHPILLVNKADTVNDLIKVLISAFNLKLTDEQNIFLFAKNTILQVNENIGDINLRYRDAEDQLLYFKFSTQDSFGY